MFSSLSTFSYHHSFLRPALSRSLFVSLSTPVFPHLIFSYLILFSLHISQGEFVKVRRKRTKYFASSLLKVFPLITSKPVVLAKTNYQTTFSPVTHLEFPSVWNVKDKDRLVHSIVKPKWRHLCKSLQEACLLFFFLTCNDFWWAQFLTAGAHMETAE